MSAPDAEVAVEAERAQDRRQPDAMPLALGGLVAMAAAMGIGRFVYTPILPRMTETLGMTKSAAGLIASANFAGYLAGAAAAATPILRGSRRRWLLLGLAASAVTTGAMGLVSSLPGFVVLRFAGGAGSAFVLVFASALVLERLKAAGRGELAAVHFAGVGSGIVVSALLVSALAAHGAGWRLLWFASGIVSAIALAASAALIPDRRELDGPSRAAAPADRRLTAFAAAYGLFGFGYVITATFLVAIVRGSAEIRSLEPLVWVVVGLAAIPSVLLWTAIGERIGIGRAFAAACVTQAAGVAASVLWIAPAGVFLAAVLLGGTIMGLTSLGLIAGQRLSRGDPRPTLGVMTACFGVGQMIGPAFAGVMHDATGSFVLPSLAAAGALIVGSLLSASAGSRV
jgi:predicted MFS family arabinose efflux permease